MAETLGFPVPLRQRFRPLSITCPGFLTTCLSATPGIGAPRPRANPALRALRMHPVRGFDSHLLFYRPIPDGIELIRVLHGARDIDAILKDEPDPEAEGE